MGGGYGHDRWIPYCSQLDSLRDCTIIMTSWHGKVFCITGPLWGESTGHNRIHLGTALSLWHHDLGMCSASLALCEGNPLDSPHKGPVKQSFVVFFAVNLNKPLSKQSIYQWFVTPWCITVVTVSRNSTWSLVALQIDCNTHSLHVTNWHILWIN